jgi:putative transposase
MHPARASTALVALRDVKAGTSPADPCRQLGCSEASFYIWGKRYGSPTEVKELRQLRDENARLKRSAVRGTCQA